MKKSLLMLAFHIPPSSISSGHLRPLGFARYLPLFGWEPVILSARESAYTRTDLSSVSLIPEFVPVYRAFAMDAKRYLGIRGKYPSVLAQPDRWSSWWPAAVFRGLRLIRRHDVRAIWSTYPIMTAHCVAYTLSRLTGLPWIADFRDPVTSSGATDNRLTVSTQMRWERRVLSRATCSVFTTPGAMRSYAERYPEIDRAGRLKVIPNGFNEDDFADLSPYKSPEGERPLHLVHAGILYPSGRNPIPFFQALAKLRKSGVLRPHDIKVTLRASGSEALYSVELDRLDLNEMVTLAPVLPYRDALAEQAQADALLLFQGDQYDNQIPAKLYEYLRIGRPIFGLVGAQGDTATTLRETGGAEIVPLDDVDAIAARLPYFLHALRTGSAPTAHAGSAARYSRREGAALLGGMLDSIVGQAAGKSRGT